MFRISTSLFFDQATQGIIDRQIDIARTQLQLSSGKRVVKPSDDPAAAVSILQLQASITATEQFQDNSNVVESRIQLATSVLGEVTNSLQRVRELAIEANNASQSTQSLQSIRQEVQQQLNNLVDLSNTRDAKNEFLFAGTRTRNLPFVANAAGTIGYTGNQQERFVQVSSLRTISTNIPGDAIFINVPEGNGTFRSNFGAASPPLAAGVLATFGGAVQNTGGAVIGPGSVTNPAALQTSQFDYTIQFNVVQNPPGSGLLVSTFDVRKFDKVTGAEDPGSPIVAAGVYDPSGTTISFDGLAVQIKGQPANGDAFSVTQSQTKSIFQTVQDLASALQVKVLNPQTRADLNNRVGQALEDLNRDLDSVIDARTVLGARLNAIDDQRNIQSGLKLDLQERLSVVQDLDFASAISEFRQEQTALTAAQQSFAQVANLSLFNFL